MEAQNIPILKNQLFQHINENTHNNHTLTVKYPDTT